MDDEDNTCALYSIFQQKILRWFSFKKNILAPFSRWGDKKIS